MQFPRRLLSCLSAGVLIVAVISPVSSFAAAKSITGTVCKKSGSTTTQSGKRYVCVVSKGKLIWQLKTTTSTQVQSPQPTGPTWAQIAAEKAAAEALAAEQTRLALEAKAKATAELKAQQEAEAKAAAAAKAEAEKPKISGLVIGDLLWGDDFKGSTGSTINQKNWTARNCHRTPESFGGGACFDTEAIYYAPSAVKLDGSPDGAAVITTTRIAGALPSDAGKCLTSVCAFTSGRFDTHGKVSFQYGFIEARIKMPAGSGNQYPFTKEASMLQWL